MPAMIGRKKNMDTQFGRRARAPRLTPLASCLGLALAVGTGLFHSASVGATPSIRQPHAHRPDADVPLAMRFPAGDPRKAIVDRVLNRVPPDRPAGAIPVTNCNDAGAGSLRDAVDNAVSGDVVDMTSIGCSTITLTTGAIIAGVDDLTLQGPGFTALTIDGGGTYPVLVHIGAGTFAVEGLTAMNGYKYGSGTNNAPGGCIYSQGTVFMNDAGAKYCDALAGGSGMALGGAVYGALGVTMVNSTVSGSEARSTQTVSRGGGVYTPGALLSLYSTIRNNTASSAALGYYGFGGGIWALGDASVIASTINGNMAGVVGGADLIGIFATTTVQVGNSTVYDNYAYHSYFGSGVYIGNSGVVSNSTITGNVEANPANTKYGAGLNIGDAVSVDLESTIVSANILMFDGADPYPSDIGSPGTVTVSGANNLVGWYAPQTVPPDTIVSTDPGLGPLSTLNGGPTATMMPLATSLAINAGNNVNSAKYDQRGAGFPRVVGANADIGAVESDVIFANGFD
jgi:hypothetical protein